MASQYIQLATPVPGYHSFEYYITERFKIMKPVLCICGTESGMSVLKVDSLVEILCSPVAGSDNSELGNVRAL
jgi:hypothetical protein